MKKICGSGWGGVVRKRVSSRPENPLGNAFPDGLLPLEWMRPGTGDSARFSPNLTTGGVRQSDEGTGATIRGWDGMDTVCPADAHWKHLCPLKSMCQPCQSLPNWEASSSNWISANIPHKK